MPKKLPKTIYVARKFEGDKEEYLLCAELPAELAELGQKVPVARYEQIEVLDLDAVPVLRAKKRKGSR